MQHVSRKHVIQLKRGERERERGDDEEIHLGETAVTRTSVNEERELKGGALNGKHIYIGRREKEERTKEERYMYIFFFVSLSCSSIVSIDLLLLLGRRLAFCCLSSPRLTRCWKINRWDQERETVPDLQERSAMVPNGWCGSGEVRRLG